MKPNKKIDLLINCVINLFILVKKKTLRIVRVLQMLHLQHPARILRGEDPEIWPKAMTTHGQYQI